MAVAPQADSIMQQLRSATRPDHERAEKSGFQQDLLAGRLPRERYADSLEQLLCVHRALEAHLQRLCETHAAFRAVVRDEQFQEPHLCADLEFFDRRPADARPLPATKRMIDRIDQLAAERPVALLGVHYVLEGSKNGAKFLADSVRRAYGLTDGRGTRALDPYGPQQRARWTAFREAMDRIDFTPPERTALVDAAGAAFSGITEIYEELHAAG